MGRVEKNNDYICEFDNMQNMKRALSAIIISAAMLAACSEDITFTPGISFLTPDPEILEETAIFRVIGQSFSSADSVRIPVVFGGTAEAGSDYEASADHFVFSSESPTDSIVISTKRLGTEKTVSLTLQIPDGFVAGKYPSSEFKLQGKYGKLSFGSQRGYIADTTKYTVSLSDSTGAARVLSRNSLISFAVDKEKSTAVEGTDFEFIGGSSIEIAGGGSSAEFTIAPIAGALQKGRDKIVLKVESDDKFDTGMFPELELGILKPEFNVLDGNWKIDTLVTDSPFFEQIWGEQCTGYELVPKFSSSDSFEISFEDASFQPAFRSGLKNFFNGDSQLSFGDEVQITDTEGNPKRLQMLSLDKTNRYFSETEVSEDSLSFVGVHLMKVTEEETEIDMMEFYFIDHTSKSFMPELESGTKYGSEKPVATEHGTYLMATFRKR